MILLTTIAATLVFLMGRYWGSIQECELEEQLAAEKSKRIALEKQLKDRGEC